ncbi:MAG: 4-hydroxy-tetrahydrodipicolinate reductase [Bacillota bacterium]|nr:4-hydroxy-tetrahydrodipicolinate reductase [Bacillota bacterium]
MNIGILGGGAMANVLAAMMEERREKGGQGSFSLAGMIDPLQGETLAKLPSAEVDVVVDFSNPANLGMLADYCREHSCPAVIATTGYDADRIKQIEALATRVPIVFSANYSLGINIMKRVLAEITPILEDTFDMEIIEKHHNKKLDSPSGTALMLLKAMDGADTYDHVFGRDGNRKRGREIGIHAVRGGTIAGEHAVLYAGEDELLEIKHTAGSKKIFAAGALKAAAFVCEADREPGLYTMDHVLFA